MTMTLGFFGAAGTVTGSRYLLSTDRSRLLVDCGLFQGLKQLRLRNRAPFPIAPAQISAVVLTHAHLDHSGYLPLLVKNGFKGRVYCTAPTADLCGLLLPDSGYLQEEEAEHANRHRYAKHEPALPLYTRADAERCLTQLEPVAFHQDVQLDDVVIRFQRAGHILGAATLTVAAAGKRIVFSGDIGRASDPVLPAPEPVKAADVLLVESTYGDRSHPSENAQAVLGDVIVRTAKRGGTVVIPAFAVGRAQLLLYHIHSLAERGVIPRLPVYIDSPMAADVTELLRKHRDEHKLSASQVDALFRGVQITNSVEESKAIDRLTGPAIIISASGMATGGRVLFHLRRHAPDDRSTILLAGYQAAGTRGAQLLSGAKQIKMFGSHVPVRAEVIALNGLSAHADANEIMQWLHGFEQAPGRTFVIHGEPVAADALRQRIEEELRWQAVVPEANSTAEL